MNEVSFHFISCTVEYQSFKGVYLLYNWCVQFLSLSDQRHLLKTTDTLIFSLWPSWFNSCLLAEMDSVFYWTGQILLSRLTHLFDICRKFPKQGNHQINLLVKHHHLPASIEPPQRFILEPFMNAQGHFMTEFTETPVNSLCDAADNYEVVFFFFLFFYQLINS